jgi:hypothetical protein
MLCPKLGLNRVSLNILRYIELDISTVYAAYQHKLRLFRAHTWLLFFVLISDTCYFCTVIAFHVFLSVYIKLWLTGASKHWSEFHCNLNFFCVYNYNKWHLQLANWCYYILQYKEAKYWDEKFPAELIKPTFRLCLFLVMKICYSLAYYFFPPLLMLVLRAYSD